MRFKEKFVSGMAIFMAVAVSMYYVLDAETIIATVNAEEVVSGEVDLSCEETDGEIETEDTKNNKAYIVKTKNQRTMELIQEKYSESDEINCDVVS